MAPVCYWMCFSCLKFLRLLLTPPIFTKHTSHLQIDLCRRVLGARRRWIPRICARNSMNIFFCLQIGLRIPDQKAWLTQKLECLLLLELRSLRVSPLVEKSIVPGDCGVVLSIQDCENTSQGICFVVCLWGERCAIGHKQKIGTREPQNRNFPRFPIFGLCFRYFLGSAHLRTCLFSFFGGRLKTNLLAGRLQFWGVYLACCK